MKLATTTAPATQSDLAAVKARQRAAWAADDYAVIDMRLQIVAELLCEAVDLRAGSRVLDVAAGNGNAALAAARRWGDVIATDHVPALLDGARERAAAERLQIEFTEADAENLDFPDASFDVVLSTFGVMFAPDQERAASELTRVCRAGGKIGLASWTPESFIGQLFRTIDRYVPPPPGLKSPVLWGTEVRLAGLFGGRTREIDLQRRHFVFRYRSPGHWLAVFRTCYGPLCKAFGALDADKQAALERDLLALVTGMNRSGDATLVLPSEYAEVVITRG